MPGSVDEEGQLTAGVFENGVLVPWTLLERDTGPIFRAARPCEPDAWIDEEPVFGGYLTSHFGHFLLESLSRVWLARQFPRRPIVWLAQEGDVAWQREIFALLGLANPSIVLSRPTGFRRMLVPQPGYVMLSTFHDWHRDFLARYPAAPVEAGKKVWLSRARLPENVGTVANQQELEERLVADGWTIHHPEEHPVMDQLAFLADAERIAGIAGSAFHAFVLMQRLDARIDILGRGPIGADFRTIAAAKGLRQREHVFDWTVLREGRYPTESVGRWASIEPALAVLRA